MPDWQLMYGGVLAKKVAAEKKKDTIEGEGEGASEGVCETPGAQMKTFTIDVQGLTGARPRTLTQTFTSADMVASLRKCIQEQIDPGVSATRRIVSGTQVMDDKHTLGFYGMESCYYTVTVMVELGGGALLPDTAPEYSMPHVFNPSSFPALNTTPAADDLMCIDDSRDPRVVAPCGKHAFTGETYYQLMKLVIDKDQFSVRLNCPMSGCGVEIPFEFVKKAAMLSMAEVKFFAMHLGMRAIAAKFRHCPGCKRSCVRPERLDYVRVTCGGGCRDFCFQCGDVWKGGGFQVCGNERCGTYQTQLMIANAPEVKLLGGHMCPDLRACPKCLALIQHVRGCKHFTCFGCGFYFCFICLKAGKKGSEDGCAKPKYKDLCELAPRQIIK